MPENLEEEIELAEEAGIFKELAAPKGVQDIKHESIFILAAHNMSGIEIARELGISQPTVYTHLNTVHGAARVSYHREQLFANKPIRQKMEALSRKAIENLEFFLSPVADDKYKIQATTYVLDQNLGKAKQSIQVETSLLSVFMDKLSNAKDVTPENKFASTPDALDNFVDEVVKAHVVGVKNSGKP